MKLTFYLSAVIAVISTALAVTRSDAVHALLYLILSFLSLAAILFMLGAPFVAVLEIIIYAGTIMVLVMFVIMMLGPNSQTSIRPPQWLRRGSWALPLLFAAILFAEMAYVLWQGPMQPSTGGSIEPKSIGIALFGPYLIGVELASMLLLAGLLGAYLLGRREIPPPQKKEEK